MTAPIKGPIDTHKWLNSVASNGLPFRSWERFMRHYTQKPPYNLPLEFGLSERRTFGHYFSHSLYGPQPYPVSTDGVPTNHFVDQNLYNDVYAKFKKKMGASVSAGVAFAEGRQAMGMMSNRLLQMAKFTNELRRGRFGDAAKTLGLDKADPRVRRIERERARQLSGLVDRDSSNRRETYRGRQSAKRRDVARSFADTYLEFHFGWSPLLNDIHEAAETLSSPIHPHRVVASGNRIVVIPTNSTTQSGADRFTNTKTVHDQQYITLRADVAVANPNLALAQQCGLVNPATVAWELVPFSFVLDWFVNVGDFLSSFTDFAGLSLTNQHRTIFTRLSITEASYESYNHGIPSNGTPQGGYTVSRGYSAKAHICNRIVGAFPGPFLAIRNPWSLSPRRGLAAVSLLIQGMPRSQIQASRPVVAKKQTPFRGKLAESYWHL